MSFIGIFGDAFDFIKDLFGSNGARCPAGWKAVDAGGTTGCVPIPKSEQKKQGYTPEYNWGEIIVNLALFAIVMFALF